MSDVLLILGLGCLVYAGSEISPVAGFIFAGLALILLALAYADTKIRLPRLKLKVRLWRRS